MTIVAVAVFAMAGISQGADTDTPSPDPMTWSTAPNARSSSIISMTATAAYDASGVEYFFDCTTTGGRAKQASGGGATIPHAQRNAHVTCRRAHKPAAANPGPLRVL